MAPVTILIVDKTGTIKESAVKTYDEAELYKKAGFKTPEDFKLRSQWNVEDVNSKSYSISVFGKVTGRANQENKYDFPPPIDTVLFFGNCIIVNKDRNGNAVSIKEDEWESVYEYLFGGFDDLGDKDSDDEEEDDEDDDLPRTKQGYVKDDFVVDDDDIDDDDYDDEEEEEEDEDEDDEEDFKPKPKRGKAKAPAKAKAPSKKKGGKDPENIFTKITDNQETYLDCTSELCEEEYV
jgi:hypothetical protein